MKKIWTDVNVVILGLSMTGIAVAKYLSKRGANCTISEKRESKPEDKANIEELENLNIKIEMGENKKETILAANLVVTSPGIPPRSEVIQLIKENKIQLISEPELAYMESSIPIIAITGTNGKSTTTTLISNIFKKAEYKAPTCGNIGYPIIYEVEKENDFLIAEVSSFQLEYSPTFKPQIAVFLNYTPDHVDWHGSEEEYLKSKSAFIKGSRSPMWVVLNVCDPVVVSFKKEIHSEIYWFGKEMGEKSSYIVDDEIVIKEHGKVTPILKLKDIQIIGKHNQQNVMSAVSTARLAGIDPSIIAESVKEFKGIEHRIEFVTTIDGIDFYNDSKATNCDAAICALRAFEKEKIVLIAGGRDKGTDLTEFVEEINNHANAVVLIGEAAERFEEALKKGNFSNFYKEKTFEDAINKAYELKAGPVVLSPACASYDMFKNFEERGHVFKDIVIKKKKDSGK